MAEYVKFRLTAAKVGVSMALMALIAGIAEKAQSRPGEVHATPAAQFSRLSGFNGVTQQVFLKMEKKLLKLNSSFLKLQNTLTNGYYSKLQTDGSFLKITDANAQFLKITDANAQFLKIGDANSQFLKIGDTAANSALLGNLRPDQFFQGRGNVLTNELPATQTQQTLLGDGSVKILIGLLQAGQPSVWIENDTNQLLNFSLAGGAAQSNSVAPGQQTQISPQASQMDIQIFGGGGGAGKVWTATLSDVGNTFVGQMLIGLL